MAEAKRAKYFCEGCGSEVAPNAKFCPKCGRFFAAVRCPNCGHIGTVRNFLKGCPACHYAVTQEELYGISESDKYSAGELTFDEQRKGRIAKVFELNRNPIKSQEELDSRFSLYWSTYEKEYNLFSDALPALKKLSDINIQMGIITNGDSENQRSKLKKTGITDFFSPIIISSEVGISKPDLKIFQKAMELANSSESETWYIGDSLEHDIVPARKLGINTLYLSRKRQGELKIEQKNPLYAEVKDFYEMTEIIENALKG